MYPLHWRGNTSGERMQEEDFDNIIENVEDEYIWIETDSLTLRIYPYYQLPARMISQLYGSKNNIHEFISNLYEVIHLAMEEPENFEDEVYDAPLSYEDLISFYNEWVKVSSLIRKYRNGEVDENGDPTVKVVIKAVDIYEWKMLDAMKDGEEIRNSDFIRWLSEHIKRIAKEHNKVNKDDKITKVVIDVEDEE